MILGPKWKSSEVGMNIEEFNTLIEDVHQKMREDAQKEAEMR